jgi:hypothetical protein
MSLDLQGTKDSSLKQSDTYDEQKKSLDTLFQSTCNST